MVLIDSQIAPKSIPSFENCSFIQSVIPPQFLNMAIAATTAATTAKIIGIAGNNVPVKKPPIPAIIPPSANNPPKVVNMAIAETMNGANSMKPVANPPTTVIVFLMSGDNPLKITDTRFNIPEIDCKIGANTSANDAPKSAITIVKLFCAVFNSSIGSCVFLKVSSTVPAASSEAFPNSSRLNVPRLIASTILTAPFVPNTSVATDNASVSLEAFLILSIVSPKPCCKVLPSFEYATDALLKLDSAAPESTPAFSKLPISVTPS